MIRAEANYTQNEESHAVTKRPTQSANSKLGGLVPTSSEFKKKAYALSFYSYCFTQNC